MSGEDQARHRCIHTAQQAKGHTRPVGCRRATARAAPESQRTARESPAAAAAASYLGAADEVVAEPQPQRLPPRVVARRVRACGQPRHESCGRWARLDLHECGLARATSRHVTPHDIACHTHATRMSLACHTRHTPCHAARHRTTCSFAALGVAAQPQAQGCQPQLLALHHDPASEAGARGHGSRETRGRWRGFASRNGMRDGALKVVAGAQRHSRPRRVSQSKATDVALCCRGGQPPSRHMQHP
jgi:hypothetical protein